MVLAAARMKNQIVEAREDPGKFIELVFRDQKGKKVKLQPFHWEWIDILSRHRRVQIEASRSHGKCLAAEQRIHLADGSLIRADDASGAHLEILTFDVTTGRWGSNQGCVLDNGKQPLVRVQTRSGRILRRTPEEPLLTPTGFVQIKDLAPGSFVASAANAPEPPAHQDEISNAEAAFTGFMLGNGGLTTRRFTESDTSILSAFTHVARKLGFTVRHVNRNDYGLSANHTNLYRDWAAKHGLTGCTAPTKRVAECVFRSSREAIRRLVVAYWDCDGEWSLEANQIGFSSASRGLLEDMQTLLLRLGLPSSINVHNSIYKDAPYTSWRLTLGGDIAGAFFREHLRPLSSRSLLPDWPEAKHSYRERANRIPVQWIAQRGEEQQRAAQRALYRYPLPKTVRRDSAPILKDVLASIDEQAANILGDLERLQNVWWDEIVEVTREAPEPTYSVTIPENPVYVCENTISHNTTIILGYLLWRIGTDHNIRIKLFTQSEEKARERLTVIGDMVTSNQIVKLVFPDLMPAKRGVWHKTAIQVDRPALGAKDPTLEASGIMGSVEGGRADLIVFDDVCLAEGTPVITRRGLVPIEEVRPRDYVRNHQGSWSRVGMTMQRGIDRLLGLIATGSNQPVHMTHDHPVYACKELGRHGSARYTHPAFVSANRIWKEDKSKPRWFLAHPAIAESTKEDAVLRPWGSEQQHVIRYKEWLLRPVLDVETTRGDFIVYNLKMDEGVHSYEGPGLVSHNCDFRTSIIYPMHREAIKKKIYAEIMPMLEEDGGAVSIATPHHESDAVASLRSNREWKSYVFAVGAPDDPFLPLWPARWPRQALEKLRNEIGPVEYDRAYRCKAVSSASQIVQPEHIQYYTAEMMPDPWGLICIQSYDLAGTTKKKSSYFACVTLLYDPEANVVYVADAWHDKLSFADQASAIVNGAIKWQPDRIVIEQTGYQSALREYLLELAKEPLPIVAMTPGSKSKELRLTETLPMFEAGRIYFNPALDPGPNPDRSIKGDIVGQLLDFAQAHDQDLGDAFAYAIRMCRAFRQMNDDDEWAGGEGVSTRMSIIGT